MVYLLILAQILIFELVGFIFLVFIRKLNLELPLPDQIFYVSIFLGLSYYFLSLFGTPRWFKKLNIIESRLVRILISGLIISLFLTLPLQTIANVDRSRSLYMFGWINCSPKGTTATEITSRIEKIYGIEAKQAFDMRVSEQVKRGFISERDGRLEITTTGSVIFKTAQFLAGVYNLKGWYDHDIWENRKCL